MQNCSKLRFTAKTFSAVILTLGVTIAGTAWIPAESSSVYAATAQSAVQAKIEGKTVKSAAGMNDTVLVSLRDAAEAFGAKLSYDGKSRIVTIASGGVKAVYALDSDSAVVKVNGSSIGDRYEAKMIKGVSYVDVKALALPFGYHNQSTSSRTADLTQTGQNAITIAAAKLPADFANGSTKVNVLYPVVSGLDNAETQQAINETLKTRAEQFLAASKTQFEKSNGPAAGATYEFYSDYEVTYNRDGVVSFLLGHYTFLGGANGTIGQTGMTFSLTDGRAVELSDLLQADPQANNTVKKLVEAQIKKDADLKGYNLADFNAWTKGMTSYLEHYYLTDNGVTVFFPLNNSAPSALGVLEFEIPWNKLLKSDGSPL